MIQVHFDARDSAKGITVADIMEFNDELVRAVDAGELLLLTPVIAKNSWTGSRLLSLHTVHNGGRHAADSKLEKEESGGADGIRQTEEITLKPRPIKDDPQG